MPQQIQIKLPPRPLTLLNRLTDMTFMRPYKLVTFMFLIAAMPVPAQVVGGTISGVITDATGSALPGAMVSVKSLETGAERKLASDEVGHYAAPSLSVGSYSVTASKEGFSPSTKTGITLVVAQKSEVDIQLAPGEVSQAITVEAEATPVNTSTDQTSGLVAEQQVKDLPLNGRSYDQLITLNPG